MPWINPLRGSQLTKDCSEINVRRLQRLHGMRWTGQTPGVPSAGTGRSGEEISSQLGPRILGASTYTHTEQKEGTATIPQGLFARLALFTPDSPRSPTSPC